MVKSGFLIITSYDRRIEYSRVYGDMAVVAGSETVTWGGKMPQCREDRTITIHGPMDEARRHVARSCEACQYRPTAISHVAVDKSPYHSLRKGTGSSRRGESLFAIRGPELLRFLAPNQAARNLGSIVREYGLRLDCCRWGDLRDIARYTHGEAWCSRPCCGTGDRVSRSYPR